MSLRSLPTVIALSCAWVAGGCVDDRPPSRPGGAPSPVGTVSPDGDVGDGVDAGAPVLSGLVCVVDDLRAPSRCAAGGAGQVSIVLRGTGVSAESSDSGAFELPIARSEGDAGVRDVTLSVAFGDARRRPALVVIPAAMRDDAGVLIPVTEADAWTRLVAALIGDEPDGTSAIVAYVSSGGAPAGGVEVAGESLAIGAFYDTRGREAWAQQRLTGSAGAALVLGIPAAEPTVALTFVDAAGGQSRVVDVPITAGATTFTWVDLDRR